MGKSKQLHQDMRVICTMPDDTFQELKDFKGVYKIKSYDNNLRAYYQESEEWQEADAEYKRLRKKKERIESDIEFKNLTNK